MKEKNMVMLEFTGKEVSSGRIFDTTSEATAKQNGLYREGGVFRAIPVIVGNGDVLSGLDEALKEMREGETKKVRLSPEKAFGNRKSNLIVVVPLQEFRTRKIQPVPGLIVDLNGNYGRVQTISGGRVRVDLNNDLAGKEVEYEIKITKEITDLKEKADLLTQKFFPLRNEKVQTKIENDVLKLKFPSKEIAKQLTPLIVPFTQSMKQALPEIKSVEMDDSFEEKPKKENKKE